MYSVQLYVCGSHDIMCSSIMALRLLLVAFLILPAAALRVRPIYLYLAHRVAIARCI